MKPWEETWELRHEGAVVGVADKEGKDIASAPYGLTAPDVMARLQLLSAAPEMARLLLAIEWIEYEHCSVCPVCHNPAELLGHAPDCALDAALRKAGVR